MFYSTIKSVLIKWKRGLFLKKILFVILTMLYIVGCGKGERPETIEPVENIELMDAFDKPTIEQFSITISAAGDVTLGNYDRQAYGGSFNQMFEQQGGNYAYFFQNVREIFEQDDFTIVNLEGVLTTSTSLAPGRTYNIKGDPSYKNILVEGNVEGVSMENNHRRDWGAQGTTDTVAALDSVGISYAYEENLGYYETNGIKIGWVSVNPASWGASVEEDVENGIKKLKEDGVDLILACCHWGKEGNNYPIAYQTELGRKCIDWGADLVIGHHPHVLQGIDQYNGKLIIYSLANFSFGANKNPSDKDTMIFQQTFHFQKTTTSDGEVTIEQLADTEAKIIPCKLSSITSKNDYCPTPQNGEAGQKIIDRVNTYSKDFGVTANKDGELQWTKENASE